MYVTIPESTCPTPAPSICPSVTFSQTVHPHLLYPRLPPSLVSDRLQIPAPKQKGGSVLPRQDPPRASGRHTVEFIDPSILVVRWRRIGDTEGLRWAIQVDVVQVALKGKTAWCAGKMW